MGEFLLVAVLTVGCALSVQGGTSTLKLTVSPPHDHIEPGESLTLMCHASAPITHCQLLVNDFTYDLSDPSAPHHGVVYHGEGLEAGDCGFTINSSLVLTGSEGFPVTCRVRSTDSDWTYGLMVVNVNDDDFIPLSIDKRLLVAQPGSELNILYKLGGPSSRCKVTLESWDFKRWFDISKKGRCTNSYNICTHGEGVGAMECGVTIRNVTEDVNGLTWFYFYDPTDDEAQIELDAVLIIVAKPPSKPVLSYNITMDEDGTTATLHAECRVSGSRPAAKISWYLAGNRLSRKTAGLRYVVDDEWTKLSDEQTTTQTLTRRLTDEDDGVELWCLPNHPSLPVGARSSRRVRIQVSMCPPLTSKTLLISCYLGSKTTDCAKRQGIGTVAQLSCKPGYVSPPDVIFRTTTCTSMGTWDLELFKCSPDCGRRKSNNGLTLISNGEDAKVGEFPWHVGIYQILTEGGTPFLQCGGSLITAQIVATAAHCFYDPMLGRMRNASEFRVAAGKHLREWEDTHPDEQRRNITDIRHRLYRHRHRNFASDFALVRLSEEVEINAKVNLVCVDWESRLELRQLRVGSVGVVPGWGKTETGSQSNELKYIDLPYVPADICLESLNQSFSTYITDDKFCAGYINQSRSVCRGDSGGGLVFRDSYTDKHYLKGVVSISFTPSGFPVGVCYSQHYTAFTLVSQYIAFMRDTIRSYVIQRDGSTRR